MALNNLSDIINKFYSGAGDQIILNEELGAEGLASAILEAFELSGVPSLILLDVTAVRMEAMADSSARLTMCGFPNVLSPRLFVTGGLTDGKYRSVASNVGVDFDNAGEKWGNEKASQWYAVYAIAGDADSVFTLKAMPWMRVKSQASQTISLGTNTTPATGIGYGFTTDELVGGKLYMLSGASRGLLRTITANNNDNGTGGTITYSGDPLTLSAGDSFIVLPNTNFRLVGDFYNNSSSNITLVRSTKAGSDLFTAPGTFPWLCPAWASFLYTEGRGGGGGGSGGQGGGQDGQLQKSLSSPGPGSFLSVTIGSKGTAGGGGSPGNAGGVTSFGSIWSASGGGGGPYGAGTSEFAYYYQYPYANTYLGGGGLQSVAGRDGYLLALYG